MSEHVAEVRWTLEGAAFTRGHYQRGHSWEFDGGAVVRAAASPHIVPRPFTDPSAVDPEEAFVASIASCHLLTFLHLASRRGFVVKNYEDRAVGSMTKNERGVHWVSEVCLNPKIEFEGTPPTGAELDELHERAHAECFISNSVKTVVTVAGVP
jgi:organic hydroperoxide reductase OsmC/OhrA